MQTAAKGFSMQFIPSLRVVVAAALGCAQLVHAPALYATTSTATFTARIIIQADCQVLSPTTLDFGTVSDLTSDRDETSTFSVQCTNTTPYDIGLNEGTTSGGTVATRKMTSSSETVDYRMYSDPSRSTVWGNTVGTDTIGGTGNGAAQAFTIYGRAPVQTTPGPGLYTDTVTITIIF
jgi:spore coat protein U-like protein